MSWKWGQFGGLLIIATLLLCDFSSLAHFPTPVNIDVNDLYYIFNVTLIIILDFDNYIIYIDVLLL